jgi:hypothetical protein
MLTLEQARITFHLQYDVSLTADTQLHSLRYSSDIGAGSWRSAHGNNTMPTKFQSEI